MRAYTVMCSRIGVGSVVTASDVVTDEVVKINVLEIITCTQWNANMRALVKGEEVKEDESVHENT